MTTSTPVKAANKGKVTPPNPPVKAAPMPSGKGRFGRAPLPPEQKLANLEAQRKAQVEKQKAFAALPPVEKAKRYLDMHWKGLERLAETLTPFDTTGAIKTMVGETTECLGGILDSLKALPADFKPHFTRGRKAVSFEEGSEVYFKTTGYQDKFHRNFASQGPHRVIELTPDGEFVMLQGAKYVIGIPRNQVTESTPAEQEKALAEWHAAHPEGLRKKDSNGSAK